MSTCPSCGKPATGKFCGNCGNPLKGRTCRGCGVALGSSDCFCHKCGAAVAGPGKPQSRLPWIVAGAAVVILILVVIVRFTGSRPPEDLASVPNVPSGQPATGGQVDLSQMSPREAADRLFERIMIAHEQGNASQVTFFLPMALQSYQMLGQKDADAYYHLGLIHTIASQTDAALAQADSLELVAPSHLFAAMLRAATSQLTGDSVTLRKAYRDFTDRYEAEIGSGKPEYGAHRNAIDAFRSEASGTTGG